MAPLRSLLGERSLVRSSAVVFVGNGAARLLGFLFYVVAARLLNPADYGTLAYALAILVTASIFLTNAPGGLARFLARNANDRAKQDYYYSNWIAVAAIAFLLSVLVFIPFIPITRLTGWFALGIVVNLANIAVFETYLEAQRGLSRFTVIGIFYTLANLLQLLGILVAGVLGFRSASLFLIVYGLSAIAAVILLRVPARTPLRFQLGRVNLRQMGRIGRYIAPIVAQGLFHSLWWGADLILINRLISATASGNYAAAKTLTQALTLAPAALTLAAGPRLSRLSESDLRKEVFRLLGLASVVILPPAALLVLLQHPLTHFFYGSKYTNVLDAFDPLTAGFVLYGFYAVLASVWGALGRPLVGAVTTGCGTVTTVALAIFLIPSLGLVGGGIAFAAGAGTQLLVVILITVWGLFTGTSARYGHLADEEMLADPGELDAVARSRA
jgi:O-antigen/teichoic acid export membrane protein